jgi:tRNA pseudouridine synthase 10
MYAGREDLDVRMLGRGRPFVLELADARSEMPSQQRLLELQEQLKASGIGVEVLKLQAAPKSILKAIKV